MMMAEVWGVARYDWRRKLGRLGGCLPLGDVLSGCRPAAGWMSVLSPRWSRVDGHPPDLCGWLPGSLLAYAFSSGTHAHSEFCVFTYSAPTGGPAPCQALF